VTRGQSRAGGRAGGAFRPYNEGMRYTLSNVEPIAGFTTECALAGETTAILVRGFLTPEGHSAFYTMLDQLTGHFLGPFTQQRVSVSTIDHFLVILRSDQTATVYVNELGIQLQCFANKAIEAGSDVMRSDVIGISSVTLVDIEIPDDASIFFFFSLGWRRGIYVDLDRGADRERIDLRRTLAHYYEALWFGDLYAIPGDLWPRIFAKGWFPFIALIGGLFEEITGFLERNILHAWEEKVFAAFTEERIQSMLDDWRKTPQFEKHIPFFEKGVERYLAGDFISAVSNVWPRIEGVLRFVYSGQEDRPGQRKLLEEMKTVLSANPTTPGTYMPELFREYLSEFYYADFNVKGSKLDLSRHSLAHGVAEAEDYSRKKALIAFLIVHQLFYYMKVGWSEHDLNAVK
jgi:hypothetical protein